MCLACSWSRYMADARIATPSRRSVLRAGALFAGGAVASRFSAEAVYADTLPSADSKASLIFRGGGVYTVDPRRPWVEAVAVRGKQIVYVGDDAGAEAFAGPATRIVDLHGRMLLPGFIEGHIHPFLGSAMAQGADVQQDTKQEVLRALETYAATAPRTGIIRGFGWRYDVFPEPGPRREDLDRIWPDQPVLLLAIDGHSGWVNSKVLAMAGVTRDTPETVPGFSWFAKDPKDGEPTGFIVEVPALMQILAAVGPFTLDFVAQSLAQWMPKAAAAGITAVFDAGMQLLDNETGFGLYSALEKNNVLTFRVVGSYYHNNPDIDPLPIIQSLRKDFQSELVRAQVLKLNMDGGDFAYTAAMLEPYSDNPGTSGSTLLSAEQVKDITRRADAAGIDIHVHSYGDRSTRLVLDAIEAAIAANPPRERRNAIAHWFQVDETDIPRFARSGVIAQFSPQWGVKDPYWHDVALSRCGPVRAEQLFRVGSFVRAGAPVSFGSDWPAAGVYSTYRPLDEIEIEIAMTRRALGKPDQPPLQASEQIDLEGVMYFS